jgi:hypothetical protein
MSSCASGGRLRAASTARSRSFVIGNFPATAPYMSQINIDISQR